MTMEKGRVPVARLGALERAVMETLWDLTGSGAGQPSTTARQVVERLSPGRSLAYTTVLTVLDRLERKGLVRRLREGRPHRYVPVATREAYAAELMLEALGRASDRDAALMRFVDAVSPEEAEALRRALLGETAERPEAPP
jgi:predicted transcriptional regulator